MVGQLFKLRADFIGALWSVLDSSKRPVTNRPAGCNPAPQLYRLLLRGPLAALSGLSRPQGSPVKNASRDARGDRRAFSPSPSSPAARPWPGWPHRKIDTAG